MVQNCARNTNFLHFKPPCRRIICPSGTKKKSWTASKIPTLWRWKTKNYKLENTTLSENLPEQNLTQKYTCGTGCVGGNVCKPRNALSSQGWTASCLRLSHVRKTTTFAREIVCLVQHVQKHTWNFVWKKGIYIFTNTKTQYHNRTYDHGKYSFTCRKIDHVVARAKMV